jgi:hypothetical protein
MSPGLLLLISPPEIARWLAISAINNGKRGEMGLARIIHGTQSLTGLITYFQVLPGAKGGGGGCATLVTQTVAQKRNGAHFMRPPPPRLRANMTSYLIYE